MSDSAQYRGLTNITLDLRRIGWEALLGQTLAPSLFPVTGKSQILPALVVGRLVSYAPLERYHGRDTRATLQIDPLPESVSGRGRAASSIPKG